MNHSCDANVKFYPRQDMMFFKTKEPIASGEELQICYIDRSKVGGMSKQERRDYLLKHYGFWCMCKRCSKE